MSGKSFTHFEPLRASARPDHAVAGCGKSSRKLPGLGSSAVAAAEKPHSEKHAQSAERDRRGAARSKGGTASAVPPKVAAKYARRDTPTREEKRGGRAASGTEGGRRRATVSKPGAEDASDRSAPGSSGRGYLNGGIDPWSIIGPFAF
jgi:hypothetical protein